MTGIGLFLRSRHAGATTTTLLLAALAARALRAQTFGVGSSQPLIVPWATLVPLIQAGGISATIASVHAAAEATAARSVRSAQLGVLTGPLTAAAFNRNLLGLLGLSLVSARLLGATLLWVLPVLSMITALALGGSTGANRMWAWTIQPDADPVALAVAAALGAAGVVAGWHIFDRRRAAWG